MLEASRRWRRDGRSIGLVPTMGALHAGHARLLESARFENEVVVASVFVNPIQFGPHEDFGRYPGDWDHDLMLLGHAEVDAVYRPSGPRAAGQAGVCGARRPGYLSEAWHACRNGRPSWKNEID